MCVWGVGGHDTAGRRVLQPRVWALLGCGLGHHRADTRAVQEKARANWSRRHGPSESWSGGERGGRKPTEETISEEEDEKVLTMMVQTAAGKHV
ncbi:hypothetical protein NDU88_008493 [Pleurodeles waltl]|uniref:Uncharacterized protein n=1 Tax=Pleurodeles waltl TaxID=8319 RepID=A0AAV7PPA4_PLEWA|nr:hypothetical protein NDU88_008493 [Pleurodeles waltl]